MRTCQTCAFWGTRRYERWNWERRRYELAPPVTVCTRIGEDEQDSAHIVRTYEDDNEQDLEFVTRPDFGCTLHKEKDTTQDHSRTGD